MPTPEQHALLSASSSERWLHCTPSARLGEQFPDTGSKYAAAGTLACPSMAETVFTSTPFCKAVVANV